MVRQARLPFLSFAFLATGIYAVAITVERMRPALRQPELVSLGVLVDLLVVVPLAFLACSGFWQTTAPRACGPSCWTRRLFSAARTTRRGFGRRWWVITYYLKAIHLRRR
jgi:hypothetical protein